MRTEAEIRNALDVAEEVMAHVKETIDARGDGIINHSEQVILDHTSKVASTLRYALGHEGEFAIRGVLDGATMLQAAEIDNLWLLIRTKMRARILQLQKGQKDEEDKDVIQFGLHEDIDDDEDVDDVEDEEETEETTEKDK